MRNFVYIIQFLNMDYLTKPKLNLQPLGDFLTYEITPEDFVGLLDELLYDYFIMLIRLQLADEDKKLHLRTEEFIYILRTLRDVLLDCYED